MTDLNLKDVIRDKNKETQDKLFYLVWEGLGFAIIFALIYLIDTYF